MRYFKCPKCQWESSAESSDYVGLFIQIDTFFGNYCLRCWAESISKSIPKMEEQFLEKEE